MSSLLRCTLVVRRRLTASRSGIPHSASGGRTITRSLIGRTYDQFLEKLPAAVSSAALLGGGTVITGVALYGFAWVYHRRYNMTNSVKKRFLNPNPPPLIREGDHFSREKEEEEIKKAFLNKSDSLGLVGVVFGPAGTGKSNVVRTVCRSNKEGGVIYMEIGSPRQFPYHLAKACGVPVEPNWWDAVVAKLFGPTFRTYATLPSSDQDALALVLPIIAEGAKAYMAEGAKAEDAKAKAEEAKAKAEEAKAKAEEAKAKAEDAKAKAEEAKAKAEDAKAEAEEAKAKAEEAKAKAEDAKAKAEDAKAEAEDAKAKAEDAKAKDKDAKAKAEDAKAKAEDAKAKAEDAKAKDKDAKAKAEDAKAKAEDAKAKAEDAKAKDKDAKAKDKDAKAKDKDAKAKDKDAKAKDKDAKAKAEGKKHIPVLFIDGVDILAKEEDNRLYVNLVDWAKKCANEDSLRIVLVCSDSHVLALDQQSFKSRLDALIEIDDASETQAVNELMMKKYQFTEDLAKSTYDIVGGRLADIHKMVSIYNRAKSQEVVNAQVKGQLISNFKQQFIREMEQALCKAIGKDKHKIKKFIIQQVLKANGTKTVEEIAFLYNDSTKIHEVIDAIKELLRYNVLRINKDRKLLCYNKTAKEVLEARCK